MKPHLGIVGRRRRRCSMLIPHQVPTLALCITLLFVVHVVPTVDAAVDHELKVIVGDSAMLPCDFDVVSCGPVHTVKIYKNGNRVFTFNNNSSPPEVRADGDLALPKGRVRFDFKREPVALQIDDVYLLDEGLYRCEVTYVYASETCKAMTTTAVTTLSRPTRLDIYVDGALVNMTKTGPFNEGTKLKLSCESIGGRPVAQVTWRNGSKIMEGDFSDVQDSDEMELGINTYDLVLSRYDFHSRFECQAMNEALEAPLVNWFEVQVLVRPLTIDVTGLDTHVTENDEVTLECEVTGALPAATIQWFNDTTEVDSAFPNQVDIEEGGVTFTTRSKYTFQASRYDNGAKMRCLARNRVIDEYGDDPMEDLHQMDVHYAPRVSIVPEGSLTVNYSGSVTFYCHFDANPTNLSSAAWFRNGKKIDLVGDSEENDENNDSDDEDDEDDDDDDYDTVDRIVMKLGDDDDDDDDNDSNGDGDDDDENNDSIKYPSLQIKTIMHIDKGIYTCQVENEVGGGFSSSALILDVYYPPVMELTIEPEDIREEEDVNVTLKCDLLTANPEIINRYLWLKDGIKFEETDENEHVLLDVDRRDAGNYSCAAHNSMGWGRASKSKSMIVKYPPGMAKIDFSPFVVVKGQSLNLTCVVKDLGQPPAFRYRWYRDVIRIEDAVNPHYIINPVTIKTLSNFTCTAFNEVGEGPPAAVAININAPPTFIQSLPVTYGVLVNATNVSLTCQVECVPMCTITWKKNNEEINNNSPLYSVKILHESINYEKHYLDSVLSTLTWNLNEWPGGSLKRDGDNANYSCESSMNVVGMGNTSTTYFRVEFPPENINVTTTNIVLLEGEVPPSVECDAIGFPEPIFMWMFGDEEVVSVDPVLHLNYSITRHNSGTYTCYATNTYGNQSATTFIDVQYEPECNISKETTTSGLIVITCAVAANPGVDFEWLKNNETMTENIHTEGLISQVKFHEAEEHYATYTCIATNVLGSTEIDECEIVVSGEGGWLAKLAETKTIFVTAAVVAVVLLLILIVALLIRYWRRRKAAKGDESGDKKKKDGDDRAFYENLPFHGLQPPPNKPFRPVLPDLEYADVDFPARPLNNNHPYSKAKIVEQILEDADDASPSTDTPMRPPRTKSSARK